MAELSLSEFDWELHSELVKSFHEDLVLLSFPHGHMPREDFLELFRSSEKDGPTRLHSRPQRGIRRRG